MGLFPPLTQMEVYLVQVIASVVAGEAVGIDSEEGLPIKDGKLVVGVELLHHAQVFAVIGAALDVTSNHNYSGRNVAAAHC